MMVGDRVMIVCQSTGQEVHGEVSSDTPGAPGHVHYLICGGDPHSSPNHTLLNEGEDIIAKGGISEPIVPHPTTN